MINPAELDLIKKQVEEKIEEFQKEVEVGIIEKEFQLNQAVESGEMIPERAKLELEKAQKMAVQAIEEQRMQLTAEAQDAASTIAQQVMSESDYKILEYSDASKNIVDAIKFHENRIILTCTVGDEVFFFGKF